MHDIDARKFQCASKTVTSKIRETHGTVFLIQLHCVIQYWRRHDIVFILVHSLNLTDLNLD